jgi:SAM-dependent methyltransferase
MPRLHELWDAAVAEPYMEGTPFRRFDADAGRVLGYQEGDDEGEAAGDHHVFEAVFRGSEELVRRRQQRYVTLLRGRGPVVDFGCGRGELLDLLREAGIEARGVDLDPELVAHCRRKGHADVNEGDGIAYLAGLEPGTVGAICAMQVVERLDSDSLGRLLGEARRALRGQGRLILETVNPHSPRALKAFWVDPGHVQPVFPEVLLQLCRQADYREAYAFIPTGDGDWDADRVRFGEYAVVATP